MDKFTRQGRSHPFSCCVLDDSVMMSHSKILCGIIWSSQFTKMCNSRTSSGVHGVTVCIYRHTQLLVGIYQELTVGIHPW